MGVMFSRIMRSRRRLRTGTRINHIEIDKEDE
jgi:hypothetical protein